jgi:predicted membrane channel-forming protein YqfA (hemolysin III family)
VRQFDIAAMFVSLWLLVTMIIDVATPKELTVYMIAAVTAPAFAVMAVLYWKRVPKQDFAIVFATLWLIVGIVLELISPTPLHPIAVVVAGAPLLIVGLVIHFLRWRGAKRRSDSAASAPE